MNNLEKINLIKKQKYFVFGDIFVFIIAAVLIATFTVLAFAFKSNVTGKTAEIYKTNNFAKNELLLSVNLDKNQKYAYTITDNESKVVIYNDDIDLSKFKEYNVIVVENGQIFISESSCSNHNCITTGKISKVGQSISCLPHNLLIKISGESVEGDL